MDLLNDENGELKTDHEIIIDDLSKMNLAELPEDAGVLDDEDEEEINEKEGRVWRRRERPLLELKMENTMALLNKESVTKHIRWHSITMSHVTMFVTLKSTVTVYHVTHLPNYQF